MYLSDQIKCIFQIKLYDINNFAHNLTNANLSAFDNFFFRYIIGHYLNVHLYYAYMQCFLSRTLKLKCIGAQIVSYFENALSDFHLLSVVMSWEWANTRKWKTRFSSDFLPHLIVFRYYGDLKPHLDFFC